MWVNFGCISTLTKCLEFEIAKTLETAMSLILMFSSTDTYQISCSWGLEVRGGARGGLEGAIAPLSEHASPLSEGEKLVCRRFLAFTIP